ncbi:hypothetical protein CERSUDRAFT_97479 [Gelatoporia subvermispora B]|uniref:Uncharacterized protein n=1 Tax=Ceriporiopsis subvermispora (strain B) TaxID=914234 RepID=M2PEC2_CERS8|nr:hypothetical protein CERSUDRAFT_97479 [Gelatoporia subvermispora B]
MIFFCMQDGVRWPSYNFPNTPDSIALDAYLRHKSKFLEAAINRLAEQAVFNHPHGDCLYMASEKTAPGSRIAIIGAGVGGVTFAIGLQKRLGFHDFTIFEQGTDVGGTWRDNTYPGCCSDVPTHWYSLSSEPNPYWSRTHVPQSEIQAYWQSLARKYGLYTRTSFRTCVSSAAWDDERSVWVIELEDLQTGARRTEEAEILVSAVGLLGEPRYPTKLEGRDRFKGELLHSARWNHGIDLRDKRVAVIGNGCSGVQLVPEIVKESGVSVVNFCRTPSWLIHTPRGEFKEWHKWIFAHIPMAMRAYRAWIMLQHEMMWPLFSSGQSKNRAKVEETIKGFIRSVAPESYHDQLMPNYPLACKRLVVDTGYLAALHRPNLDLNWDGIAEITEDGIRTQKGENITFDIIIFSTGYVADTYPVPVRGKNGRTIQQYFDSQGGPTAYRSVGIPGFPNFYMLGGPNSNTSIGSVIFFEECQAEYILQLCAPVLSRSVRSFTITQSACDAYNADIQARISRAVYPQCNSWYRAAEGTGKNFSIFPGPLTRFWWIMRSPIWDDYEVQGAEKWKPRSKLARVVKCVGLGVALACTALVWLNPTQGGRIWST